MTKPTHEERLKRAQIIAEKNEQEESTLEKALSYPVRKSNDMIQKSRYSLTLREQRLLLYIISKIKADDIGNELYRIKLRDAAKICGVLEKDIDGRTYKAVFDSFATLRDRGFTIYTERGTRVQCAFIEHPTQDESGDIVFNFDPYVVPYLFQVKKRFTQYNLGMVIKCRSTYGIRLYELLKSYENLKEKKFTLEELRERLGAESNSYKKNYGVFKKYVLLPAVKDLESTDLKVDFIELKEGRRIVGIEFIITEDMMQYYEKGGIFDGEN